MTGSRRRTGALFLALALSASALPSKVAAPRALPAAGGQDGSVTLWVLIPAALGLGLMATGLAVRRRLA